MRNIIRIAWASFVWHLRNPYGYCMGWNYQTCVANRCDCIFVKKGIHCSHLIEIKQTEKVRT